MPGWPFLVGAGRRRDFSTLLAPDFLVAERAHGVFTDVVSARDDAAITVLPITISGGRRLTLAFRTHLVTADDLEDAGSDNARPGGRPRDEHSRPLRLAYGFVVPDAQVLEPAEADLTHALELGLDVYRRFLADEEGFAVRSSAAFRLQSRVVAAVPLGARPDPAQPFASTQPHDSAPPHNSAPPLASAPELDAARGPGGIPLTGILALTAAVVAALLFHTGVIGDDPAKTPTPTSTSTIPTPTAEKATAEKTPVGTTSVGTTPAGTARPSLRHRNTRSAD